MKQFKILFTLAVFFISLGFSSCNTDDDDDHNVGTLTDPISSFSWTGNDKPAPVTEQFVNNSQNADQYEWNFGDNSMPSTVKNPSHTYHNNTNKPKSFYVTLKVTDSNTNKSNTRSRTIVIQPSN
jgi:PKD repeat protein